MAEGFPEKNAGFNFWSEAFELVQGFERPTGNQPIKKCERAATLRPLKTQRGLPGKVMGGANAGTVTGHGKFGGRPDSWRDMLTMGSGFSGPPHTLEVFPENFQGGESKAARWLDQPQEKTINQKKSTGTRLSVTMIM